MQSETRQRSSTNRNLSAAWFDPLCSTSLQLWGFHLHGFICKNAPFRQTIQASCLDVTVVCPLADSYVAAAAREAGSVAELPADRKSTKYTFITWTVDTCYTFSRLQSEPNFRSDRRPCSWISVKPFARFLFNQAMNREASFLFQRISVLIQRFNAILLHDSFVRPFQLSCIA